MGVPEKYRPVGVGTFNVTLQDPNMIRMDSTQQGDAALLSSKASAKG